MMLAVFTGAAHAQTSSPHVASSSQGYRAEFDRIDLDTGAWEVDPDEITAARRVEARHPDAQIWVVRVGSRYLSRFGTGRRKPTS